MEVYQGNKLRILSPEVVRRKNKFRMRFDQIYHWLIECDACFSIIAILKLVFNYVCQCWKEKEAHKFGVILVHNWCKKGLPVFVIILNKLIAERGSIMSLFLGGRDLSEHDPDRTLKFFHD